MPEPAEPMSTPTTEKTVGDARSAAGRRAGFLIRFLVPRYDEVSLFMMSLAFLGLLVIDGELRAALRRQMDVAWWDPRIYLVAIPFAAGMLFALFNALFARRKSDFEKTAMLFFAVTVSAFAGIAAGIHLLAESRGWMLALPIWNIADGVLLLLLDRLCYLDNRNIADEDATPGQVGFGALVVLALLAVCCGICRAHWAITLSICVAYATNINWVVMKLSSKAKPAVRGPARGGVASAAEAGNARQAPRAVKIRVLRAPAVPPADFDPGEHLSGLECYETDDAIGENDRDALAQFVHALAFLALEAKSRKWADSKIPKGTPAYTALESHFGHLDGWIDLAWDPRGLSCVQLAGLLARHYPPHRPGEQPPHGQPL